MEIQAHLEKPSKKVTRDLLTSPYSRNLSAITFQQIQYFISMVIFAPLWEEAFFRGVLFRKLNENIPIIFSIIISSAIFTATHSYDIRGLTFIFSFGILVAIVYKLSNSWLVTIVIHSIWNLFAAYYMNFL